jgi:hypothetical protein
LLAFVVRAAGEKHQAAALTPEAVKMTESLKEDQRGRRILKNRVLHIFIRWQQEIDPQKISVLG